MTESRYVSKRGGYPRKEGLGEIEQPRASGVESVREQEVAGRHLVLGVMRVRARRARGERGDNGAVVRRAWIGIDDAEEVAGLSFGIASPDEQVRIGCSGRR